MKDAKYLLAYYLPATAFYAIYAEGWNSLAALIAAFVVLPLIELFAPQPEWNHSEEVELSRSKQIFFDFLLYFNVPILYFAMYCLFQKISTDTTLTNFEIIAKCLSVGMIAGTVGINVAHELGHRSTKFEQFLSKMLLVVPLYMHFFIEHNRGHHKNVATDKDPASARFGEAIYTFWLRSIFGSYINAWHLEVKKLQQSGQKTISWHNEMLIFQIIQITYLALIAYFYGFLIVLVTILVAIVGVLLLESVNYIEHYGLRRKMLENGQYERVLPKHSWNSNHEVGRIMLYELTRHADHHYKSSRKYQILRHHDESPQLDYGYPTSILIALVPPLWFRMMDKKIELGTPV